MTLNVLIACRPVCMCPCVYIHMHTHILQKDMQSLGHIPQNMAAIQQAFIRLDSVCKKDRK